MKKTKIEEQIGVRTSSSHIYKLLVALIALLFTNIYTPHTVNAQELGQVWDKVYGATPGRMGNIYPNKEGSNYTAIATERDEDGNLFIGKIYEVDESGAPSRTITVNVKDGAYAPKTPGDYSGVQMEPGIAFKRDDGGVLAFFNIYDSQRDAADRQPPGWNGYANQLLEGIWIIGYDGDGEEVVNEIARGTAIFDGLQLKNAGEYSGFFMVGGLDANASTDINANNVTLLRIYNQDGGLEKDYRGANPAINALPGKFNLREVVSLHMAEKQDPDDSDQILIATIQWLARIDNFNNTANPAIAYLLANKTIPGTSNKFEDNPNIQSMTPTADGGMFVESMLQNHWQDNLAYSNGRALVKLVPIIKQPSGEPDFELKYAANIDVPGAVTNSLISYNAPYLLPNKDYGGVVQYKAKMSDPWSSYIYELKDNGTSSVLKPSPPFPAINDPKYADWVSLEGSLRVKRSSKVDGFFALGEGKDRSTTPPGSILQANIIKLSTCANFFVNNVPSVGYYFVKPRTEFTLSKILTYQGAGASVATDVKYTLTATVLSGTINGIEANNLVYPSVTGSALSHDLDDDSDTQTYYGNLLNIDDSFTVLGDQPVVQYTLTYEDNYSTPTGPQVCQQTAVFYLAQELDGGITQGPSPAAVGTSFPSDLYVINSTGGVGENVYQWQEKIGNVWTNIPGATSATYRPTGNISETKEYRRGVSNMMPMVYSEPFVVRAVNYADIDVVSLPTAVVEDGSLIIKTAVKNISPIATTKPFGITIYLNNYGAPGKYIFTKTELMNYNETQHYEIKIDNYTTSPAWTNATQLVVSYNDIGSGEGNETLENPQNLGQIVLRIKE